MFASIYRNGNVKVASTAKSHRINVTNHEGGITITAFAGKGKGKRVASLRLAHADAVAMADALWQALEAIGGGKVSMDLPSADPDVDKYNADGEVEAEKPSVVEPVAYNISADSEINAIVEGDGGMLTEALEVNGAHVEAPLVTVEQVTEVMDEMEAKGELPKSVTPAAKAAPASTSAEINELLGLFFN